MKKIMAIAGILILTNIFSGCSERETVAAAEIRAEIPPPTPEVTDLAGETGVFGDTIPISRSLVAKMLAFTRFGKSEIDNLERSISFSDTRPEMWFDRYINACFAAGLMSGAGGGFMPDEPLTLGQAQILLDKLDAAKTIKLEINAGNRDKAVSYALWTEMYEKALESASGGKGMAAAFGIAKKNRIILAAGPNNSGLRAGTSISDAGPVSNSGLELSSFLDREITVLEKDGEIIGVCGAANEKPIIKNAYVVSAPMGALTIFSGGVERSYKYAGETPLAAGTVCDVTVDGADAIDVKVLADTAAGTVKRLNPALVELDGAEFEILPDVKVYSAADGPVKWKTLGAITVGTDIAVFILRGGKVCSAIITKAAAPENIRVLIGTTGFNGYVHDEVEITSDRDFLVKSGGSERIFKPGESFRLEKPDPLIAGDFQRTYVIPSPGAKLRLNSLKRAWADGESPLYRGVLEIAREGGGYSVINELPFEEYLYAVVPSETPTYYGLEALKVQTVAARSFAYNQYYQNRYAGYGAHVDDSVSCQVYNNIPENADSIRAVNETAGLCIVYDGRVVSANFFSTSSGTTTDAGQVWAGGKDFPALTAPYLTGVSFLLDKSFPDLTDEKNAYDFFKDRDVKAYDSEFPFFRWTLSMTAAELSASINAGLAARYKANPSMIKTLQKDSPGLYKSAPISDIGELRDIEVIKRGKGGNIMTLRLTGTKAEILVSTEYNVRVLLKPSGAASLIKKDGTEAVGMGSLPSAFFSFDKIVGKNGELEKLTIYGGGYGHGVGMSQNAAKGMTDAGMTFIETIEYFYRGAKVAKMF